MADKADQGKHGKGHDGKGKAGKAEKIAKTEKADRKGGAKAVVNGTERATPAVAGSVIPDPPPPATTPASTPTPDAVPTSTSTPTSVAPTVTGPPTRTRSAEPAVTAPAHNSSGTVSEDISRVLLVPVQVAQKVMPTRRAPVYLGAAALALLGVLDWPIALGAGLAWEALNRWGPEQRER